MTRTIHPLTQNPKTIALYKVVMPGLILVCTECGRKTYHGAKETHLLTCPVWGRTN